MKNIANDMNQVDGGIVKQVLPLSRTASDQIAVIGVWSGGEWNTHEQTWIQQFRNGNLLGRWKWVGVTLRSGRDAILQLALPDARPRPAEGDILVFGPGSFTTLDVVLTTLPIKSDRAVEVGRQRHHGIALTVNGVVRKLIYFHSHQTPIPLEPILYVWWQGRQYMVETVQAAVRVA